MKRAHEDGSGQGAQQWRRRDGPKMKYCLKALIPDVLASFLLRDKGTLKDELQQEPGSVQRGEESGSRLVFSNKGDFFPDTQLRVLGDERSRYPPPGCEMLGKDEGSPCER
eukprot:Skav230867  [mRNA]  locus=scaffold1335:224296:235768:- [translate_table: standard]